MHQLNDGRETHQAPVWRLAPFARAQHGLFTRAQATEAGFTRSMIDRRVAARHWERVDYNVYRRAETPPSWRQRLLAACLAGPAVASHRAAAELWSLPGFTDHVIEVVAWRHRRRHAEDVMWHESRALRPRDVTTVDAVPVTSAARTVLDLASVVEEPALEEALDDVLRRGLTSLAVVARSVERLGPRRRGSGAIRRLLLQRGVGTRVPESVLETRFLRLLRASHLPTPVTQAEIRDGTRFLARVDFAFAADRVAVEIDGYRHHSSRAARQRDLARQNALIALGWRVLRFTDADLRDRPDMVIAVIDRALRLVV